MGDDKMAGLFACIMFSIGALRGAIAGDRARDSVWKVEMVKRRLMEFDKTTGSLVWTDKASVNPVYSGK